MVIMSLSLSQLSYAAQLAMRNGHCPSVAALQSGNYSTQAANTRLSQRQQRAQQAIAAGTVSPIASPAQRCAFAAYRQAGVVNVGPAPAHGWLGFNAALIAQGKSAHRSPAVLAQVYQSYLVRMGKVQAMQQQFQQSFPALLGQVSVSS